MIFLILDILVYNYTKYNSYLILLNLYKKNNVFKIVLISLILDFIIFKTYYKFSFILITIFTINKKVLKYNLNKTINFISLNIINYIIFILLNSIVNNNVSYFSISLIIVNDILLNMIISIIYYYKFIKH